MRTVERIEQPSTSAFTTATRFAIGSLFMLTIMLTRPSKCKHYFMFDSVCLHAV